MSLLARAKQLAEIGFHVFPLIENKKLPSIKDFTGRATTDLKKIEKIWFDPVLELERHLNIGIVTSKFGTNQGGLLVVDVDNKGDKNGSNTLLTLESDGFKFPKTMQQKTPTGGFHLIYSCPEPVKQGVSVLGPGLDIRSKGGYIVGAGSLIDGVPYLINKNPIVPAPQWLIDKCNEKKVDTRKTKKTTKKISQRGATARGRDYLLNIAPVAVEGDGGDRTTFIVANKLKDLGVTEANALQLMLDNWNDNCQPPWLSSDLENKVKNAYAYGQNEVGADSPENDFSPIAEAEKLGPIEKLNEEFAFVVLGGKSTILRQRNKGEVSYMTPNAFHDLLASDTIQTGNGKRKQLSELWFSSPKRATYNSVELVPAKQAPPGVFNLWRGFSCEPLGKDEKPTSDMIKGVAMFKEHALKNVCLDNEELYNWLMGYFAHLIQKPWEKPLTAIVFKGKKGVGKNALIDSIGNLFNGHYLLTSSRRYLTGNFNKHLANLILFVLDEAFWSGDKQAEGILKDLITGHTHLIEHKGREMFSAKNVTRICILGNEEWLVPATEDERRFAVFNVGTGRRRDKAFFVEMTTLLEKQNGKRLLLTELHNFDLSSVDINDAPQTAGLLDQKVESLPPVAAWWLSSLKDGAILNLDFGNGDWPTNIGREQLREAFSSYAKNRGIRSWLPDASAFGRDLLKCCPGIETKRLRDGTNRVRSYKIPSLETSRSQFDTFIEHSVVWEPIDDDNVIDIFS